MNDQTEVGQSAVQAKMVESPDDVERKYTLDDAISRLAECVNFVEMRVGGIVAKTQKIAAPEGDFADPSMPMQNGASDHVQTISRLAERLNDIDNRIIKLLGRIELD